MGDITARILSFDGHLPVSLLLGESDRPAWCVVPQVEDGYPEVWVPASPETVLSDGMLMWMLRVVGVRSVVEAATSFDFPTRSRFLELGAVPEPTRQALYNACRDAEYAGTPLIVTRRSSYVAGQLRLLDEYRAPLFAAAVVRERYPDPWGAVDWSAPDWPSSAPILSPGTRATSRAAEAEMPKTTKCAYCDISTTNVVLHLLEDHDEPERDEYVYSGLTELIPATQTRQIDAELLAVVSHVAALDRPPADDMTLMVLRLAVERMPERPEVQRTALLASLIVKCAGMSIYSDYDEGEVLGFLAAHPHDVDVFREYVSSWMNLHGVDEADIEEYDVLPLPPGFDDFVASHEGGDLTAALLDLGDRVGDNFGSHQDWLVRRVEQVRGQRRE